MAGQESKRQTPTIVEIDLEALRFNFHQLKKKIPPKVKNLCVVKSNAYGHGAIRVARVLQEEGADFFGVATVDEGIDLREAGVKKPILILIGVVRDGAEALVRYQLTPVIYDWETAETLNQFISRKGKPHPIHLKVDTGMTRLGVPVSEIGIFCDRLKSLSHLIPEGLMTHLAIAGCDEFTGRQKKLFLAARDEFLSRFSTASYFHLANSRAVIFEKIGESIPSLTMVRLGIALYGAHPQEEDRKLMDLKPVLTWKSQLISVKKVPAGTSVSYGRTFTTKKDSWIGVIPVGYSDGYRRVFSNQTHVLMRGRPCPVAGTICMDMMMIDLTGLPSAPKIGEEVILIGQQRKEEIRAFDLAQVAKTIPYEIFCGISDRLRRVYV